MLDSYRFRQQTDLFYLTGWLEPDSFLVLGMPHEYRVGRAHCRTEKTSTRRGFRMSLYVPPSDPVWEHWHGPRSGVQGAISDFGADDAIDVALFPARLRAFLEDRSAKGPLYLDLPDQILPSSSSKAAAGSSFISRLTATVTPGTSFLAPSVVKQADHDTVMHRLASPNNITRGLKPLKPLVEPLRLIKSEAEIALLHRAAEISAHGHAKVRPQPSLGLYLTRMAQAMAFAEPGRSEAQVAATFEHACIMDGASRRAFVPVCASGDVALTMHYTANDRLLPDGALVLFDAGCEYGGYSADMTRTFPVSGTFSEPQRDLYAAVLSATKAVSDLCTAREGLSLRGLHRRSVEVLRKELSQLGVQLNAGDLERRLYPHFVGQCVGLPYISSDAQATTQLPRH
jgi:intermediate cleaving peptidase 55